MNSREERTRIYHFLLEGNSSRPPLITTWLHEGLIYPTKSSLWRKMNKAKLLVVLWKSPISPLRCPRKFVLSHLSRQDMICYVRKVDLTKYNFPLQSCDIQIARIHGSNDCGPHRHIFPYSEHHISRSVGSWFFIITWFTERHIGNSTFAGATAALMANVVLVAYVVVAMKEDESEKRVAENKARKGEWRLVCFHSFFMASAFFNKS